jgi:replicative DNA helicase
MSRLGVSFCLSVLQEGSVDIIRESGITAEMLKGPARDFFEYMLEHHRDHGQLPHLETLIDEIDLDEDYIADIHEPPSFYAKKVIERDALNAQRSVVKEMSQAMRAREPVEVHETAKRLLKVGMDKLQSQTAPIVNTKHTAADRIARYEELKLLDDGIRGIRSEWAVLDSATGGFKPGDLVTFAARMGLGKTWAAVINSVAAERQNKVVGFVSPEMSRYAIEQRKDSVRYRLPYRDFTRGELDYAVEEAYYTAVREEAESESPDWLIAAQGAVTSVSECDVFVQERKLDMLIVDGIYLLHEGDGRMPWHERVMLVVRGLKELALKREIPVLATAQFNRSVRTGSMRAGTESMGHTDAIGQFSDIVIGLFQTEDMRIANQMSLRMLKNREGPPIEMTVRWDLIAMDFSPVSSSADDQPAEDGDRGPGQEEIDW